MEVLISAVAGDLVSRFISFLAQNYGHYGRKEDDCRKLERVLLRVHIIVEEAEWRHITNRGMLLQLEALMKGLYLGYYMLDRVKFMSLEEGNVEDEVSNQSQSFAMSSFNSAKRLRFAAVIRKHTPLVSGPRSTPNLKGVLEGLETKIADMREFVMLLCSCPRLSRQPYSMYLFMDKCMFGRHFEKEQVINFLLCNDTHDHPGVSILPIIGPHRVGKKTLVQHACQDERVRNCFSHIYSFDGDDLRVGELSVSCKASSGKYLFIIEFRWDVDDVAWRNFQSCLQDMASTGIKVVVISRSDEVAKFGISQPIRMKNLSQEEYWYYFKVLAFGTLDPDEHPKLVSLGMQLASELNGSFIGANLVGEVLRANPNTQFWRSALLNIREFVQKHFLSSGVHPQDLFERNSPVNMTNVTFVGAQDQAYFVYDLREAVPAQSELPKLTSREMIMGSDIPVEDKFDVLVWKSRIPPYCDYICTFEKQKPRRMVGKRNRLSLTAK